MSEKKQSGVCLVQIHRADTMGYTTLGTEAYVKLFRHINEADSLKVSVQRRLEYTMLSDAVENILPLSKKVKARLTGTKEGKRTLAIEMLDEDFDADAYDALCQSLLLAIGNRSTNRPWCVCIAVSNETGFRDSVLLEHKFMPYCDEYSIGLILLLRKGQKVEARILKQGRLTNTDGFPIFLQAREAEERRKPEKTARLTGDQVLGELQLVFGHFSIKAKSDIFHVPAIASVHRLASNQIFVRQVVDDIYDVTNGEKFDVYPIGMPSGGTNELALAIVGGDDSRLCNQPGTIKNGHVLVILCDFWSPLYALRDVVNEAKHNGATVPAIVAVASYRGVSEIKGTKIITYLDTNYEAVLAGNTSCRFCAQEVPVIDGEHFEDYARKVGQFDPFTFWEFVSQSKDFFKIGHWPSDRTPNHYKFRIMAKPIFQRYSYDVSLRLKNLLEGKGILGSFVRKVVCTESEESTALSEALASEIGLRKEDVIGIPRRYLKTIAGKELGAELEMYIKNKCGEDGLKRQTVVIVDQAAHHFATLSSLRKVCEHYDCVVFAFLVFIDRSDPAFSMGEYLDGVHYLALYSWPVTPPRDYECPCVGGKAS